MENLLNNYIIVILLACSNSLVIAQYNLETCTTNIANDVPEFFHKYFHCVTARMSASENYVNLYFNGLPPYETWYYPVGDPNNTSYISHGTDECPPGPPGEDCYFQVPNVIEEVEYVISIPVVPVAINGQLKTNAALDGIDGTLNGKCSLAQGTPPGPGAKTCLQGYANLLNSSCEVDSDCGGSDPNEYPLGTIGVAINGVNIFNPVAAGEDVIEDERWGFDLYSAHPDFSGEYHYHTTSPGPLEVLSHKLPTKVTNTTPSYGEIEIYGITCEGTVVLGCTELDGTNTDLNALDAQHGHLHDMIDDNGTPFSGFSNRYHTHMCYTELSEDNNPVSGYEYHEFTPESAYYQSSGSDVCGALNENSPIEGDKSYSTTCTDSSACNLGASCVSDDGCCRYDDCNGECGGDNSSCSGCIDMEACNYNVSAIADDGSCTYAEFGFDCDESPLSNYKSKIPESYSIHNAYPNPFNPVTNITYGLPLYTKVQIVIFDLAGKQVQLLVNEFQGAGYHSVDWNADTHSSGVYFVKMVAGSYVNTQKLMLVK